MRIFISSVKLGLEDERRAMPGFIRAIGHEPVMFEDFGARTEPSRQECLEGVQSSDVYLLLLGEKYGHRFPETGQSATHDEYVAAQTAGIPRLAFHKTGVDHEPEQAKFIQMIGDYSTGSFWSDFATVSDLQTAVAEAVRRVAAAPSPLSFEHLTIPPNVDWKDDWDNGDPHDRNSTPTFAELHASPLDGGGRSARQMGELSNALISKLRTYGVLSQASGVDVDDTSDAVTITAPVDQLRRGGLNEATPRQFGGVRVSKTGQVSAWATLPHGGMASVIDPADLVETYTELLRVVGNLNVLTGDRFAISAGIGGSMSLVTLGRAGGPQQGISLGYGNDQPARAVPDESVTAAAFDAGAAEVARGLTQAVVAQFRR